MCSGHCSLESCHQGSIRLLLAGGKTDSLAFHTLSSIFPFHCQYLCIGRCGNTEAVTTASEDRWAVCLLGSNAREETPVYFFFLAYGGFYSKCNWLYLRRRLSLILLDAKIGAVFNPLFFPLPHSQTEEWAMQLKWDSKGQLPPPFPFQKTFQSCVLLNCCIGRKHTMQLSALCWCVAH